MRTALFGGTFDPVHMGHIHLVRAVLEAGLADRVIVMPAYVNPFKQQMKSGADTAHRLEMCRIAFGGIPGCKVDSYEIDKGTVSYTADTVDHLRGIYPNDELSIMLGGDSLSTLPMWRRYRDIISACTVIAVSRENGASLEEYADRIRNDGGKVIIVDTSAVEVSSSRIRDILMNDDPGDDMKAEPMISQDISEYIRTNGLYRAEARKMVSIDEITDLIKERLSKKRYHHSLNVADSAKELAKRWGEDTKRAYLGGLVHDICKELPKPQQLEMARHSSEALTAEEELVPALWHAPAGEVYCRTELGIQDEDLLMAVRFHTVGRAGMSLIEEVIFLADLIGADRDYKDVNKMRKLAFEDKDRAMFEALSFSITDVAKKGSVIPLHTAQAYNQYAKKLMKRE